MQIDSSIARIEGTSIIFKTTPTVGLLTLTGFTDNQTTVNGSSFAKKFRYTTNGVIYSDWQDLTVQNITAITLIEKYLFIAEVMYQKNPSNSIIDVTSLSIQGTQGTLPLSGHYFQNSLFQKYFSINDLDGLTWHINVLEKVYQKGLIPNYIDRLDDFQSSDDFLALFGAVCKFFSYYVELSRVISKFYNNIKLLTEFLQQRGLVVSPENTLSELQEILQTYYFQIGKRGTYGVMEDEVLRLLHFKTSIDEYIFCLFRKHHYGWNLGNSSPLYRGLRINDSLNKISWSKKLVSVRSVDMTLVSYTNGAIITDGSQEVINVTDGQNITIQAPNLMKIDSRLDYQFSFKIKLTGTLQVSAQTFNIANAAVDLKSKVTGGVMNTFVTALKLSRTDRYLTVKLYIYNKSSGISSNNKTHFKQGNNLMFDSTATKLGLKLLVAGNANIYDVRFMPMITPFSRGFVQSNNFIPMWVSNRNGNYSSRQLTDYIDKFLIPYNCHSKIVELADYSLVVNDPALETFYWVASGSYCKRTTWIGGSPACEVSNLIWIPDEGTAYCENV
jgi:hypothetical protein